MNDLHSNSASQDDVNKPLRPVLVASAETISDYSIFLKHLLVGFADKSIPVALVCPADSEVDSVISGAVEVIRYPAFKLPLLWCQNRKILFERLEKFKPSILHCLCESRAVFTRQLARQLDLPYVLTVNSLQKRRGWFACRRRIYPFFISPRRCAKIITPVQSIAADIARACPQFAERVERINIGTFTAEQSGCFNRPGRQASMITVHSFRNESEFENLLGAVRHLAIDGYEFMLVIIGGGRGERRLRKLLAVLGISQMVVIVSGVQPCRSVLSAGDIFIQPRVCDYFNPLLLEATSVGLAVACCKGGVDDLLIKGRGCVVFDPADELSIYNSLRELLDKREAARRIAEAAQEYLRENHTVSGMISSVLQTYSDAQQWYSGQKKD